ncbi:MAG: hypothetical protein JJ909_11430, partial [Roseivirga sp.]|nr:hypothetical protein [Roseivirga sp.]
MKTMVTMICLFLATINFTHAQEQNSSKDTQLVIVYLEDKSEITGELISENETEIVINSVSLGLLTFQQS